MKKKNIATINFTLYRNDIPSIEKLKKELNEARQSNNIERSTRLFEMLVWRLIFEKSLKEVPRIEDIEIKGTFII
jgi:hypothetical protein